MGKGDRKTKKGKIFKKSYGVRRPRVIEKVEAPKAKKKTKKSSK